MWPFSRRRKHECRADTIVKRLITGLIIGGAIGSVIGRRLMEKHEEDMEKEESGTLPRS